MSDKKYEFSHTHQNLSLSSRVRLYRVLIVFVAAVATALACGWSYITDHSVRFNSYRSGRAFYRLPPLPIAYDAEKKKELTVNELGDYNETEDSYENPASGSADPADQTWADARDAVDTADLNKARDLLQKFLNQTTYEYSGYFTSDAETVRQQRRNAAFDMLDAMTALKQGYWHAMHTIFRQ